MTKYLVVTFVSLFLSACSLLPSKKVSVTDSNLIIPTPMPTNTQSTLTPAQDTIVTLKTKYGPIAIKLYSKEAPKTVANFLKKINSDFYTNLTFHRVEPGFVIQGGDPKGDGTGGGVIKSEINAIPFREGSLGLARGPIKENSNDSQFFICLSTENCQHLTNEYVNFGEVVSGLEVANKIQVGDKIIEITTATK